VPFLVLPVDFHKITNFIHIMRLRTIHTIFATDARFLIGFTHFCFIQKRMIYHFQPSMCLGTSVPQDAFFMFFPLRTRFWNVVEKPLAPSHGNSPSHYHGVSVKTTLGFSAWLLSTRACTKLVHVEIIRLFISNTMHVSKNN